MKKKIAFCIFGVVPRSIKWTYNSMKKNIIDEIKTEFDLDIYVFNLNIGNTLIDGVTVNQNDVKIIEYNVYEEYEQKLFDEEFAEIKKKNYKNISNVFHYAKQGNYNCEINAFRQLYSEYRVGCFLEKNKDKYDGAIISSSDLFIVNKINLNHFKNSLENKNTIYIPPMNDAYGYTNGFYFGQTECLIKLLKRYEIMITSISFSRDYEFYVKIMMEYYKIKRCMSNIIFFKIRANKNIFSRLGFVCHEPHEIYYAKYVYNKLCNDFDNFIKSI